MKILCLAAILAVFFVPAADAATFKPKRGISLDIWTTWPQEDQWADANAVLPFPEWRKTMGAAELKALKDDGFDFVRIPVNPQLSTIDFMSPFCNRSKWRKTQDSMSLLICTGCPAAARAR
jgi:hypothetical protein